MKHIKTFEQNKPITKLDYSYHNLTELPELPNSLIYLYCENNNLPYNNLKEYKSWLKQYIIDNPNSKEAIKHTANKYNL